MVGVSVLKVQPPNTTCGIQVSKPDVVLRSFTHCSFQIYKVSGPPQLHLATHVTCCVVQPQIIPVITVLPAELEWKVQGDVSVGKVTDSLVALARLQDINGVVMDITLSHDVCVNS